MTPIKEYDDSISDLGEYGSLNILYAFGELEGKDYIDYAIENKCYIKMVYSDEELDNVDRLEFRLLSNDRLLDEVEF
jgi:hypothetical protein